MDAEAYLKKQGWRGKGHSLDHTDRGIVRPLGISKKVGVLGVGIQKYAAVSDQWWLRAYDQGLKDLGTGKESALATAQKHGVNRGGLYARFVKGQDIPGTIGQELESDVNGSTSTTTIVKSKKDKESKSGKRKRATEREEPAIDIRQQIKAYIDEATRRGILPPDPGAQSTSRVTPAPSSQDMTAVLKLAKLHKATKGPSAAREKMVRSLRRAALQHLEQCVEVQAT